MQPFKADKSHAFIITSSSHRFIVQKNRDMEELTKDDLRQFRMLLLDDFEKILDKKFPKKSTPEPQEWLRSKAIRNIMSISPATLQNLRISGKIRFKKIMGSYYYSKTDVTKLFGDGK